MEQGMDPKEAEEIMRIATEYARGVSSSEEEAQKLLGALAAIVQGEGAKLVHLGNVLFLVLVRGKELVEVHTLGEEDKPRKLAKDFLDLSKYLKNLGVKVAYTYTPDTKFSKLAKMVDLKVQQYKSNIQGQMMNVFVVEL
jgi:hypothetical protein